MRRLTNGGESSRSPCSDSHGQPHSTCIAPSLNQDTKYTFQAEPNTKRHMRSATQSD